MISMLSRAEREAKERARQIDAIRKYNHLKRRVFDARLDKFLRLYPYATDYNDCIEKFSAVVNVANEEVLNRLIESFNEENKYWSTYYALHNCNDSIYRHIITVLTVMHDCLDKRIQLIEDEDLKDEDDKTIISDWGQIGEKEVEYVLKWLTDDFYVIEKDCSSKYSDECILLENEEFIDEHQEYDHIVVGPQGIFLIETKNYSGKLHIDNQGNWLRMKKNEYEWVPETNPAQQVIRHHVLMESIVGKEVPIIDVVCLAHPDIVTTGIENAKVTVMKKDMLGDFIMGYKGNILSRDEIESIVLKINQHKIYKV